MIPKFLQSRKISESPGVYLMKNGQGKLLYIGKAANLRRRVSSYFLKPHDMRIEKLVSEIRKIDYQKTDTAIEALILEAELIKKHQPPFNVCEKDDTSFLYVEFTKETFPRVLLVRGKEIEELKRPILNVIATRPTERYQSFGRGSEATRQSQVPEEKNSRSPRYARDDNALSIPITDMRFGPFTSAKSIREALRILRKIFPWSNHAPRDTKNPNTRELPEKVVRKNFVSFGWNSGISDRGCFDYQIGLCPGTCIGAITRTEYAKNIRNLKLFFQGKKARIVKSLEREMKLASKHLEFEKATKFRGQLFALKHIQDVAVIGDENLKSQISNLKTSFRIEGYDISNISGTSAVGSMVVFAGGKLDRSEYRKFKIRTIAKSNDVGMMKEVLRRRFGNTWKLPDLILVDGGVPQVNVAREVVREARLNISVLGIAKGPERKRNDVIGKIPEGIELKTLIQVRDEAHRFAIAYHKKLRATRAFQ